MIEGFVRMSFVILVPLLLCNHILQQWYKDDPDDTTTQISRIICTFMIVTVLETHKLLSCIRSNISHILINYANHTYACIVITTLAYFHLTENMPLLLTSSCAHITVYLVVVSLRQHRQER